MDNQYFCIEKSLSSLKEIPIPVSAIAEKKFSVKYSFLNTENEMYNKYEYYTIEIFIDGKSVDFSVNDITFSRFAQRCVKENTRYSSSSYYNITYYYFFTLEYIFNNKIYSIRLRKIEELGELPSLVLGIIVISIIKDFEKINKIWDFLIGYQTSDKPGEYLDQLIGLADIGNRIEASYPYFKEVFNSALTSHIGKIKELLEKIAFLK